jgi:hypothetical protein
MKNLALRIALVIALTMFGFVVAPAHAQQNNSSTSNDTLERLERRINEIAQRQEQMMRQMGQSQNHSDVLPRDGDGHPMAPGTGQPPMTKHRRDLHGLVCMIIFGAIIFNILIAIWIFTDIRRRGTGSGIFIVLALIAGVPAAIIYALVRIGDSKMIEPVRTI